MIEAESRLSVEDEHIAAQIVDAAFAVHSELGPGLLESAYETCLGFELVDRGFQLEKQRPMPLLYRGRELDVGYRLDLLVNRRVIVEVKSVQELQPIHRAQLLTYLRLSKVRIGFLINFNERLIKSGIRRMVL